MSAKDVVILNINGADYRCIINGNCKSDALNLLRNDNLTNKGDKKKLRKLITLYKMDKEIITF